MYYIVKVFIVGYNLSSNSQKPVISGHMFAWTLFFVMLWRSHLCNLSKHFRYTLYSCELLTALLNEHKFLEDLSILSTDEEGTGVVISLYSYQEGNKLQWRKILSFIYPIY